MGVLDRFKPRLHLHDKVVVLTGASSGIGELLALMMAREGAKLVLAARRAEQLEDVAQRCRARGGESIVVPTDVGSEEACQRLIEETIAEFGRIDVLINNAGISMWSTFDEVTDLSFFETIMRVNYLGSVYCTHHALPHLKRSKGLIVAISSLAGKTGVPKRSGYCASKHAMQGFFDSLRIELLGTGVDVSVISPGFVETGIRDKALGPGGAPRGVSPRHESAETNMSVEECCDIILEAIHRRERDVVMTSLGKVGMWVKLLAPQVIDRIAVEKLRERDEP